MLRQDRQLAQDQRQFAVLTLFKSKFDGAGAGLLDLGDTAVIEAVEGPTLFDECVECPNDVFDCDRLAVVPSRRRAEGECDPGAVRRRLDLLGDEAVLRERFVGRTRHQAVIDRKAARPGATFDDKRIEGVVTADRGAGCFAALGCVRIDVIEMCEIGGVL